MAHSIDRHAPPDGPSLNALGQAAELLAACGRVDLAIQVVEAIFALAGDKAAAPPGVSRAAA
jgi:hypothetical protein